MAVLWSHDKIMELIQLFRAKVILWDTSRKEYKDKNKKNDAFKEISRILSIPQKDVETKLHVLRTQFCREKKKMAAKRCLNIEGSEEKCKWIYYEPLIFLLRGRITSGSDANKIMRSKEIETVLCDSPHYEQRTEYEALDNVKQSTVEVSREFTPEKQTRKRKHHETVSSLLKMPNEENTFQDDDLTAFGNYIVSTLRKLNAKNCVAAQDDIFSILSKYKLRQLADAEAMFSGTSTPGASSASKAKSESPCSQDDDG